MSTGAITGDTTVTLTENDEHERGATPLGEVPDQRSPLPRRFLCGAKALVWASPLLIGLLPATDLAAQTQRPAVTDGPQMPATLAGCRLPLPGGVDRDAGLSRQHLENQEGRRYLLTPSVTLQQGYSDNIELASENTESEFVTGLIPAVSFCLPGQRLRAQVDYQAEMFHYWDDSSRNDIFHRLNADTTTTLVENRLFLDARALFSQQPISTRAAFSADNSLDTGNRTDARTLEFSPYFRQSVGPIGDTVTRYTYNRTDYDEGIDDVNRHIGSFDLFSPEGATPFTWRGSIRSERVRREDTDIGSFYLDDAFAEIGYLLTDRVSVVARGGAETRTRSDGSQDRYGSSYWESGLRWAGDRTIVDARYGRRFFGDTYFVAIDHQANRLNLRASYRETQQISDRFVIGDVDVILEFDPVTGEGQLTELVDVEQEVFINKRATVAATYDTANSQINISAFQDRQEFVIAGDNTERYGGDISWRWQWLPRTALIPRAQWQRTEFREDRTDTAWLAQISVAHLLSPTMQAGATLRRQKRTSDEAAAQYTENAIILSVTRIF